MLTVSTPPLSVRLLAYRRQSCFLYAGIIYVLKIEAEEENTLFVNSSHCRAAPEQSCDFLALESTAPSTDTKALTKRLRQ